MKITKKFKGMLSLALTAMLTLGTVNVNAETADSKNPVLPEEGRAGSITIHKYAMDSMPNPGTPASGLEIKEENKNLADLPQGAEPLEGVSFKIEKVADNTLPEQIKGNNTEDVVRDKSFRFQTITTGNGENGTTKGVASIDRLPQGIYLVTELDNAGVLEKGNPFLVSIPMAHPTIPNSWLYDVHVYPKNVVAGAPSIDKDVTSEDNKHDSANIGENVTWIIKPSIPADIEEASKYEIIDDLSEKLNYTGNLEVYYYDNQGNRFDFTKGQHYTTNEPYNNEQNGKITVTGPTWRQKLTVSFTPAGRTELARLYKEEKITTIRISFTTVINKNAELGKPIPNNAVLDYTNSFGTNTKYEVEENRRPEVHTGGIQIEKVDASNNTVKLPGAKFKIYTSLKDAQNNEDPILNPETGEVWEIITDDKGIATFRGLSYGSAELDKDGNLIKPGKDHLNGTTTYWLVETEAPWYDSNGDGEKDKQYNLLREPVAVTIDGTETALKIVTVENRKFTLPVTGGVGTVIFTLGGLAIMGAAAFLYMRTTRRA